MNKAETQDKNVEERVKPLKSFLSRRSFLGKSLAVGAGTIGAGLLANAPTARASGGLTRGDADILNFALCRAVRQPAPSKSDGSPI